MRLGSRSASAGADPQLMDSVIRWVADNGGATQQLEHNYRSRPELVTFCVPPGHVGVRAAEREDPSPGP